MKNREDALNMVLKAVASLHPGVEATDLVVETPKDTTRGDVAIPMFALSKILKRSPPVIAAEVADEIKKSAPGVNMNVAGGYLNFFLDKAALVGPVIETAIRADASYGLGKYLDGKKVMVEFSGPNTNKPLHLGHMRNDCLGESVSRLLKAVGANVYKVNIINDRGAHICKSMLAYQMFGEGRTPESEGIKSDHFVGDYYVKFSNWAKDNADAEARIIEMLNAWENGDPETIKLWKQMNKWALDGISETYRLTDVSFDKIYYESAVFLQGKEIILNGLEQGVFFKAPDGSIRIDLKDMDGSEGDGKIFLRADGTSVYITQDMGLACSRHNDFPFDQLIYVVASEQQRHFQILFYALQKMGFEWAKQLYHLSYGMVNLPEGKMKSREGTVVDADDLIASLTAMAKSEIDEKGRADEVAADVAAKVALGAIHFFLLQVSPGKDMIFNPKESMSFSGATGPYLQYAAARIASLLRKDEAKALLSERPHFDKLTLDDEWALCRLVDDFPNVVEKSARSYAPSILCNYLYDLAKTFNKYYHDSPILNETNRDLAAARLQLARAVGVTLRNGMELLVIPYLEKM